ncbi:transmembrane serine/threonine-protein kinase PknQ [Mycobacteroides abscessus subsp. abscessus]|nr:transmembrane serine/threonine-protein kinase PknQ [Mycobacteroides abscessus subsp. abscessus]
MGCNTIDPVWALRPKGRETSTLYLRDRKKPEREIMIRVVPAADALSTDGASDAGANSIRQHVSFNIVRGLLVYILASGASNRNDAAGSLSATALSFATTMKILRYGR